MAEEKSRFFDSVGGDKRYSSEDFAEYFRAFLTDGIKNGGDNLKVTSTGSSMQVSVLPGTAMIRGYFYMLEGAGGKALNIEASDGRDRIDRVILRLDRGASVRNISLAVKRGQSGTSPAAPALTREGNIYELSLARVYVKVNSVKIMPADISDERYDTAVCGLINSLITLDTTEFYQQAQTAIEALQNMGGSQILALLIAVAGSGSGLDADKLDGNHGSYYCDYNNLANKPSIKGNGTQITPDNNNCFNITAGSIGAATSAQGGRADSAVQTVKCNGVTVKKDANKAVDITLSALGGQPLITIGSAPPDENTPGNIYIQI